MDIKVSGFPATFEQIGEAEFGLNIFKDGETHFYKGDIDMDIIRCIESFFGINKRFPSVAELNYYMKTTM